MTDLDYFLYLLVASCVTSFALSFLLIRVRKEWSNRRIVLLAAGGPSAIFAAVPILLFSWATYDSVVNPDSCGVDACGMMMMFSTILLGWLIAIFIISMVPAVLALKMFR